MKIPRLIESLEASIGFVGAPTRLIAAIEAIFIANGYLPIAAAENAERLSERVSTAIAVKDAELSKLGHTPVIRLVGSTQESACGYCHSLRHEDPAVAELRLKRSHAYSLLAAIRALDFSQFEAFGAGVLTEIGASRVKVTPHAGDQGIDFYGEFNFRDLQDAQQPFFALANDVRLLFAGQAKHYPNRSIGPAQIRELVGSMSLARTKTQSNDGVDIFENMEIRPFSPVLALLFSTGEFTAGATRLASSAGIVVKSGLQLAVFLADRGVGQIGEGPAREFAQQSFDDWLKQQVA